MQNNLKIVFFGTPGFVVPIMDILIIHGYQISAIVTQPDKTIGRKKVLNYSPVKTYSQKNNILVLQPNTLTDDSFFEEFLKLRPDIAVVAGYGRIIPEKYLKIAKYGFLCMHPSLLPKYRGPSPIQGAILNGDTETGVSIILIDKEMDHGPILAIEKCKLEPTASLQEAEKKIWGLGAQLLVETIPKYIMGEIKPKEQNHNQATFTKLLTRGDGRIDWSYSVQDIYNQIRALNPNPGAWTTWKGKVINIPTCDVGNPQVAGWTPKVPGTVEKEGDDIVIKAGTGYIVLKSIQLEGGKEMDAKSFVNGHPDFLNSTLE